MGTKAKNAPLYVLGVRVLSSRVRAEAHRITRFERDKFGRVVWIIRCATPECPGEVRLSSILNSNGSGTLGSGLCMSCGHKKRPFEAAYNWMRSPKRQNRRIRGTMEMTYDQFAELMSQPDCHYCRQPLRERIRHGAGVSDAIMLDRKDSNLPYTVDNTVPCCIECNYIKGPHLSEQEMLVIAAMRRGYADFAAGLLTASLRKP